MDPNAKIQEIKRQLRFLVDRDEFEWTDDPQEALENFIEELDMYIQSLKDQGESNG